MRKWIFFLLLTFPLVAQAQLTKNLILHDTATWYSASTANFDTEVCTYTVVAGTTITAANIYTVRNSAGTVLTPSINVAANTTAGTTLYTGTFGSRGVRWDPSGGTDTYIASTWGVAGQAANGAASGGITMTYAETNDSLSATHYTDSITITVSQTDQIPPAACTTPGKIIIKNVSSGDDNWAYAGYTNFRVYIPGTPGTEADAFFDNTPNESRLYGIVTAAGVVDGAEVFASFSGQQNLTNGSNPLIPLTGRLTVSSTTYHCGDTITVTCTWYPSSVPTPTPGGSPQPSAVPSASPAPTAPGTGGVPSGSPAGTPAPNAAGTGVTNGSSTTPSNQDIYNDVKQALVDAGNSPANTGSFVNPDFNIGAQPTGMGSQATDITTAGANLKNSVNTLRTAGNALTSLSPLDLPTSIGTTHTFSVTLPGVFHAHPFSINLTPFDTIIGVFRALSLMAVLIGTWFVSVSIIRGAIG